MSTNAQHPQDTTPTGLAVVRSGEPQQSTAVALPARPPLQLLRPIASPAEVLAVQEETRNVVTEMLQKGRDYGDIPGVNKPSLFKAGAERAGIAFGLVPRYFIVEREVDHDRVVQWRKVRKGRNGEADEITTGDSLGLYRYVVRCELVQRETGIVVGECIGVCSTMESKYIDRPRDAENTALKMAEKRAHVGAVLNGLGLSDQFTQDVEDTGASSDTGGQARAANEPEAHCPKCQGRMWDNRKTKRNDRAPDFKCRDRSCDGVYWTGQWPPKDDAKAVEGEKGQDPTAAVDTASATATMPPAASASSGPSATNGASGSSSTAAATSTTSERKATGNDAPSRYETRFALDPFKGERLDAEEFDGFPTISDAQLNECGRWAYTEAQKKGMTPAKVKKLTQLASDCDAELRRRADAAATTAGAQS